MKRTGIGNFRRDDSGFLLLEAIVYVVLVTGLGFIAVNSFASLYSALREIRLTRALTVNEILISERLIRAIRDAETIDGSGVSLQISGGNLSLPHAFSVDGNEAMIVSVNGIDEPPLTEEPVRVSAASFAAIDTGTSDAIRFQITLTARDGSKSKTQTITGTALLRNSYAQ